MDPKNGPSTRVRIIRYKPTGHTSTDTAGKRIYQKSAKQLQDELEDEIKHGFEMMAPTGHSEKTGKA